MIEAACNPTLTMIYAVAELVDFGFYRKELRITCASGKTHGNVQPHSTQ
jgi:hypothetical protein